MKKLFTILFTILGISSISYSQSVVTYAGTAQVSGFSYNRTDRLSAKLNKPYDMAFDSKGNMWISEFGNHTITMIRASDQKAMIRVGKAGVSGFINGDDTLAKFSSPKGIAIGPNDEIYVADCGNHVIRRISPYINDSTPQTVTVFAGKYDSLGSNYSTYPGFANGTAKVAQFNSPTDLIVDQSGNVYVSDYSNHIIRKVTSAGVVSTFAGQPGVSGNTNGDAITQAKFKYPIGLFLYKGDIIVSDYGNKKARIISSGNVSNESVIYLIMTGPQELIFRNDGITRTYYYTESNAIKFGYHDKLSSGGGTYAGEEFTKGFVNGSLTNSRFNNVKGLCYGPDSMIYIADQDNHIIRKINNCLSFQPEVTVTGNLKFCKGDSVILSSKDNYTSFLWSTSETTRDIVIKETKTITLTAYNAAGCQGTSKSIQITVLQPDLKITGKTVFCKGDSTILSTTYDYDTYVWSNGKKTKTISVKDSGEYSVILSYGSHCVQTSDTIKITVNQLPVKPTITVTGYSLTSSPSSSYQWYKDNKAITSATNQTYTATQSGDYFVEHTNASGCKNRSDVTKIKITSILNITNNDLKIYPNPSSDVIYLIFDIPVIDANISLTDMRGIQVYNEFKHGKNDLITINLSSLNLRKGVYLLRIGSLLNSFTKSIFYK
jgi:hypothetical protein